MPLQATSGAASYDAFGGGVSVEPVYIEQIFSTYLYTGNGSTQTITNGIDLSTKGGLVWIKGRNGTGEGHTLFDTARGVNQVMQTQNVDGSANFNNSLTAFNTTGFTLGTNRTDPSVNYVSWTFREQAKFFDIVTWTGTTTALTIPHNLGSVPGCIIVKRTDNTQNWAVYHRSLGNAQWIKLNLTDAAAAADDGFWNLTNPTSTNFSVGTAFSNNGGTYVAYLFAHDAGGFGLTGTDNVISCGSYTYAGAPIDITLGYEPQWVLIKNTSRADDWLLSDSMRGMPVVGSAVQKVYPNTSGAEAAGTGGAHANATGFTHTGLGVSGDVWIYIAIRRGPMKVPTDATKLYTEVTRSSTAPAWTSGFPVDWFFQRTTGADNWSVLSRLTGTDQLRFNTTDAATSATEFKFDWMNGVNGSLYNDSTDHGWMMRRAPSFMDVVCYTGTGADPQTVSHNLGKAPELMIFKARGVAAGWRVWGGNMAITEYLALSETSAVVTGSTFFGSTTPTATSFYVGSGLSVSGRTHVAYLFATAAGVSKVFSYTGNGSSQTINCGFTGGARFVLIKRTDSTGDWYVWDTARGIVAGNDPHLSLNTTSAEVTTDDTIDTDNTGFVVNQVSATNVNVSSATYIGLAVA